MKSWLFMGTLFVLCAVLGVLQYQWIGEFSVAAGERLRAALEVNLAQLSRDLNGEIAAACRTVIPTGVEDAEAAQAEMSRRYQEAKKTASGARLFRRVAIAIPREGSPAPQLTDLTTGKPEPIEWPEDWAALRGLLGGRMPWPPQEFLGKPAEAKNDLLFEAPLFAPGRSPGGGPGRGPGRAFGRREIAWAILELDADHVRDTMLPEAVQRHLDLSEYDVEVLTRTRPPASVWTSSPEAKGIARSADAAVSVFEPRLGIFEGGRGRGGRGPGRGAEMGRWTLFVRHKAGSLEAVVAQTRWRNLGVTGGVLLLLVATIVALFRFTRDAQRLAHMQMDFVAGVSHELRTPLTAIYTAGHNLRGRVAQNPAQVERYGEMIQQESGRLRDLVEQVLRFASANAGRVIQEPTPVSVAKLIDETLETSRCTTAQCTIEKRIDDGLPDILADPLALRQALQNLLANAVKYGAKDDPWIGVFASAAPDGVEIRVADRGPGIPDDEQKHIFDAFFRGRRAVQDQVHGAGLGLNLVKKIVEAHKGTIRVKSAPGEGAEFVLRLPAAAGAKA